MNLKQEFEAILEEYGHYVLLVHSDKKTRCSCFDKKTQEADRECPVCFGLGYVPKIEAKLTREVDSTLPDSLIMIEKAGNFGGMSVPGRYYYLKADTSVREADLIVDVEWREDGRPYYANGGIYEVSHIDPNRFRNGEHIFYKVHCKIEPIEKQIRGLRITESSGVVNYEIAAEGGILDGQ